jgi:hypothetical protein
MYESGEHTTAKIAEVLEVSRATLYRHLETSDGGERLDGRPITLRPWIHEPTTMHREVGPIVPGMGKELKKPGEEGGASEPKEGLRDPLSSAGFPGPDRGQPTVDHRAGAEGVGLRLGRPARGTACQLAGNE